MPRQISFFIKIQSTAYTFMWLQFFMYFNHMPFEIWLLSKGFPTNVTFHKIFFAMLEFHMSFEIMFGNICFVAKTALNMCYLVVLRNMSIQVRFCLKLFWTNVTFEILDCFMNMNPMHFQTCVGRKIFFTFLTLKLFEAKMNGIYMVFPTISAFEFHTTDFTSMICTIMNIFQVTLQGSDAFVNIATLWTLGVPATSWILTGDSQKLSFSTLTKVPFLIFWSDKPCRH